MVGNIYVPDMTAGIQSARRLDSLDSQIIFILPKDVPLTAQYRCVGNYVVYPISSALAAALHQQLMLHKKSVS
jgi:site-specific DNA-cytosine methylase